MPVEKPLKLVEISYFYSNVRSLNALKDRQQGAFSLLKFLSNYYTITSYKFANFFDELTINNCTVKIIPLKISKLTIPFKIHTLVKKEKADVILIHGINNFFQVIHLRICLGKKVKLIVQHHGERPKGIIKRNLLKASAFFVDAYLFTSVKTALELGLNTKKVFELMEGSSEILAVESAEARKLLNIPADDTIYLWVGRLIDVKNPLFFLRAFNLFSKAKKNVKLYLIYNDDHLLDKCKAMCKENVNIFFVGKIDHAHMKNWYSAADFFVSSSVYEGSGYALCEAMACNLIPIVSKIGAFDFITNEGSCALTFKSNDQEELLNALNSSLNLNKPEIKEKIAQQFKTKLSYEAIAKNFYEIVNQLH